MSVVSDYAEITRRLELLSMEPQPDAPAWWGHDGHVQWSAVLEPFPLSGPHAVMVKTYCTLLPHLWERGKRTHAAVVWLPTNEVDLPTSVFRQVCWAIDQWHMNWSPNRAWGVGA